MREIKQWIIKNKMDIALLASLFGVILAYSISTSINGDLIHVDLSGAKLSCTKSPKLRNSNSHYTGYFHLESGKYYLKTSFASCENFIKLVTGKSVSGEYKEGTKMLVNSYIDSTAFYRSSVKTRPIHSLIIALALWVVLRIPVKWFLKRNA